MKITQGFIDRFAPNPAAAANGRKLAQKGNFLSLNISADGLLLFGECSGSGKTPYRCSVDFMDEANPIARCSCPSRQIPCKHCIGLLIARANGSKFTTADVPDDIKSKRDKLIKKAEKSPSAEETTKKEKPASQKTTAARLSALNKKTDAQLEGLNMAAELLKNIAQMGLGAIDARLRRMLTGQVKSLGNYYIPGVQTSFNDLLISLDGADEARYINAINQLTYLHALVSRGREYLALKRENPVPDTETNIEELLGHAWKLDELREYGCSETEARLIQLSFNCYDDEAAKQNVDEGIWLNLKTGRIYKTRNFRPYRAAKYIKAEDTVFEVITIPELFIYPGNLNPRVRWNECVSSAPENADYITAHSYGSDDYATVLKSVKNQLRNPLADKNPVVLLQFDKIGAVTGESGNQFVLRDKAGTQIILRDCRYAKTGTVHMLAGPLSGVCGGTVLAVFSHDLHTGDLSAMPLSIITGDRIFRLLY